MTGCMGQQGGNRVKDGKRISAFSYRPQKCFTCYPRPWHCRSKIRLCLRSFWKTIAKKGKKSWVYLTMRWLFWSSIFIKPIRENDKQNLHVTEVFLKNIKSLVKGKRSIMLFTRSLSNLYNLQYFNINDTSFFNSSLSFHATWLLHTLSVLSVCQLAVLFPKYTLFVPSGKNAPHFEMDFARGCSSSRVKENGFYWRSFGGLILSPGRASFGLVYSEAAPYLHTNLL